MATGVLEITYIYYRKRSPGGKLARAPSDAFGSEVRQLAKASIARIRDVIDDIDRTLARLVETYGSCEWCDTVIPVEESDAISLNRVPRLSAAGDAGPLTGLRCLYGGSTRRS